LKVIQVPRPTAGSISPEEGTARIAGAGGAPGAAAGITRAAPEAAAVLTNVLRVMIIVCHPCPFDLLYSRPKEWFRPTAFRKADRQGAGGRLWQRFGYGTSA
jgi:hypothetical protein